MKHLLIGTAGHIDHGKTALIKALTGMDTDRLEEEKRRGITIDLGFAYMQFPDGTASIIDVPGHEKFIKNMLAGTGKLDFVLMVVAADEGVMPQTREHLAILELLGNTHGMIVLTKCDLVDSETLELAKEDVREAFSGTFMEQEPIVSVSCKTKIGIAKLRDLIVQNLQTIPEHSCKRPFRMAVDRVFTLDGFGTVATGTVLDGSIQEGEEIEICPQGTTARVRTLQSCGKQVQAVWAGQRAALNLARVKQEDICRGDLLAAPGAQMAVTRLEVKLKLLKNTTKLLKNGARVHLHLGTACVVCRVSLAQMDQLSAGETAYAQFRLETPVCAYAGDRFVVRFYSPVETIGGGVILDARPRRQKRLDRYAVERLKWYDTGSLSEQIRYEISHKAMSTATLESFFVHVEPDKLAQAVNALCSSGSLLHVGDLLMTPDRLKLYEQTLKDNLQTYHTANPLEWGMSLAELKKCIPNSLIDFFKTNKTIKCGGSWAALCDFSPLKTTAYQTIADKIQRLYEKWGYMPQDVSQAADEVGESSADVVRTIELLLEQRMIEQLTSSLFVWQTIWKKAKETAAKQIASNGSITLAQFRDVLGISRKYAAALLEHMDACRFTTKNGDLRTLL